MTQPSAPRWQHYVLLQGERLRAFWVDHLSQRERNLLFVLGRGFDPRMCMGLQLILEMGGSGQRDVLALDFREGPASPSLVYQDLVEANWTALQGLFQGRGQITTRPLEFWSVEGRRASSQNARDLFMSSHCFAGYTDVVVDVSAMPRSVFFPLLARILNLLDVARAVPVPTANLHVLVADNPPLDAAIQEEGIDQMAEFMASFMGGFDVEATQTPKVWIPLLGEHRTTQFDRIRDLVKPDEVCPVLPSPARNPRRGDNIVVEYQRVLFDELRLNPAEFLYASEQNPFEVYRQLRGAVVRYEEVFRLLGGCRVALSAMSSKLMSLGALLVAYELKQLEYNVGVAHIECQGYTMPAVVPTAELFGLWVAGECDGS
ncbi:MAG: hypothetical protein JO112_02135 [Planctomycetes bacterium]|nr:hypothetical protein [Planctomycetota bacterium]